MQTSSARAFLLRLAAFLSLAAAGGCAESIYPTIGDAKPHPGVARAHRMPVHGVDVSKWQGDVNWADLRAAGTQFAFIKATEGGDYIDEKFRQNWYGAKANGILRGAYHFVYWCRPAQEQMAWFRANVPNEPESLPPVLDVEWNHLSKTCPRQTTPAEARQMIAVMLADMEAYTGKKPIIYTDIGFYRDVLSDGAFPDYPLWVRSVAAEPEEKFPGRQWAFWQYTTTGRLPGVRGNIDRNAFAGDHEQWAKWFNEQRIRAAKLLRERQEKASPIYAARSPQQSGAATIASITNE